jgi:hypothetical protein
MAIYHLNAKTLGRSQGRSATGAAAYRAAVRIEDARTGIVFDFRRKRGVDGAEILAPDGSTPDRATLWNTVEQTEKRSDAQVAREIEVALPRELTPEQMRETVRGFVREQFVALGMVADVAFHHLTGSNPHAHILLTMRDWQGGGFGLKRREWNDRSLCQQWRQRWADHANAALAQAGQAARIDHRTLIEQAAAALAEERHDDAIALDRVPTIHERGSPKAAAHNAAVRHANAERRAAWDAIEQAARDAGRLMPPATDDAPRSKAARLAAEDLAFVESMRARKDETARRWRRHDERAREVAEWLAAKVGGDARRLAARDRAAMELAEARQRRDIWKDDHPRPFWFWKRPAWRRQRAAAQAPVEAAKRAAAKAEKRASPEAITAWRQAFADRQTERAAALAARRALAPTPSEQAEDERRRRHEREHAEAMRAQRQRPRAILDPHPHDPAATGPRPRRRPR